MSATSTSLGAMKVAFGGERASPPEHMDIPLEATCHVGTDEASRMDYPSTSVADTHDVLTSDLDQLIVEVSTIPSPPRTRGRGKEADAPNLDVFKEGSEASQGFQTS